jgi:hypothetical protein
MFNNGAFGVGSMLKIRSASYCAVRPMGHTRTAVLQNTDAESQKVHDYLKQTSSGKIPENENDVMNFFNGLDRRHFLVIKRVDSRLLLSHTNCLRGIMRSRRLQNRAACKFVGPSYGLCF